MPKADIAEDYGEYYHAGNLDCPAFVPGRLDELVESFSAQRATSRWLDIGFGAGALMQAAARGGWNVYGTEIAPQAWQAMRDAGFQVHLDQPADAGYPDRSFDVVSMVEVIEHVADPLRILREAFELLRPQGSLYLTTPHARGLSGRTLGLRWSVITPPEHLQVVSLPGLRALVSRAGFRVGRVQVHGANPYELIPRALRLATRSVVSADERVETGYRLNESLSKSPTRLIVKDLLNQALSTTRLGDSLKMECMRPVERPSSS